MSKTTTITKCEEEIPTIRYSLQLLYFKNAKTKEIPKAKE
jgi:hypothetical protein